MGLRHSYVFKSDNSKKYSKKYNDTLKHICDNLHLCENLKRIVIEPKFDFDDYKTDIELIKLKLLDKCSPPKTLKEFSVAIQLVDEDDYDDFVEKITDGIVDFLYDNDIDINIIELD